MATLFDYTNQAWTVDGVYMDCGHPKDLVPPFPCSCYGRAHAGEPVSAQVIAAMDGRERDVWKVGPCHFSVEDPRHRRDFIEMDIHTKSFTKEGE